VSDIAIRVENLGKKYVLGEQKQGGNTTLRDKITDGARSLSRKVLPGSGKSIPNFIQQEFWALKDVSFEIEQGDRVGFIGRNGAGKSTLLKILSRITEPTKGRISVKGRVASLLEVGTGFHQELTGRENVYLNGSILGMSKIEIKKKFDEIVAFAEIENFLDTPVKRYSSGMYVRLAFAVAAHLEPEILIVDEVLAVGDAQFQKKCLEKMGQVAREGRTVLFVSHNMAALSKLCDKVVYLAKGEVRAVGNASEIVNNYLKDIFGNGVQALEEMRIPGYGKQVRFSDIRLLSEDGANLLFNQSLKFVLKIHSDIDTEDLIVGTTIFDTSGNPLGSYLAEKTFSPKAGQNFTVYLTINNLSLAPGSYYSGFGIVWNKVKESQVQELDIVHGMPTFQILSTSSDGRQLGNWHPNWGHIVMQDVELTIEEDEF